MKKLSSFFKQVVLTSSETSSSWRTMHTDKIMDFKITGDFFDGKRDTLRENILHLAAYSSW